METSASTSSLPRKAFFRVDSWTDSTDYKCWIRGEKADDGQLWALELCKPDFPEAAYDGKELDVIAYFGSQGEPLSLATPHGRVDVRRAEEKHSIRLSAVSHPPDTVETEALTPALCCAANNILQEGESIYWQGSPGLAAAVPALVVSAVLIIVGAAAAYHWLILAALAVFSTPREWRSFAGAILLCGMAVIGAWLWAALSLACQTRLLKRTFYLITDRRALVIVQQTKKLVVIDYLPRDIFYAIIKKRRTSSDIIFPTKTNPLGNFWRVRDARSAEYQLARILSSPQQ